MDYIWLIAPIVLFAGIVRGFSGFGFAAISIIGVNLFFEPQQSVAIILALDILCSVGLWRTAVREADFQTLKHLTIGAAVGIPIGYGVLLLIPAEILKCFVCLGILGLSLLLFTERKTIGGNNTGTRLGFGIVAGVFTSSASVGGPVVIYYMLSSKLSPKTQRATMILFFIISESLAFITLVMGDVMDSTIIKTVAILAIPTLLAVRFGQALFHRRPPKSLKSFALPVIIIVALLGLMNSLIVLTATY